MHLLQRSGVAATAVLTGEGLYWDPQLRERGYIHTLDHPDWGVLEQPGVTVRLETPGGKPSVSNTIWGTCAFLNVN